MGDVPLTHLGQGPAAGTAPFQRDFFLKKRNEVVVIKGQGENTVAWWLPHNNNLQDGLSPGASQGWGCLHGVCDHPASLLLLCCKRRFGHVFPTSPCLKQRAVGLWEQTDPQNAPDGREGASPSRPGQQHKPWVSSWSFATALHPLSPLPQIHPILDAPRARLPHGVPGLPLSSCPSKASPACLLFPAPPAARLPGLTRGADPSVRQRGQYFPLREAQLIFFKVPRGHGMKGSLLLLQ